MSHLVPCPECQRHVRAYESTCPFCGVSIDLSNAPAPAMPTRRLGRAALFAFGATLAASVTAPGCGGDTDEDGKRGAGGASGSSGSGSGGSSGQSTGGAAGSGGSAGGNAGAGAVGPVYGLPADAASVDLDGAAQPLYGAPPDPGP